MRMKKESEKVGLKLNIKKAKIMAFSPITSWQIDDEKMETVTDFIFLVSKITADSGCHSGHLEGREMRGPRLEDHLTGVGPLL